jgi:hypothetical protein
MHTSGNHLTHYVLGLSTRNDSGFFLALSLLISSRSTMGTIHLEEYSEINTASGFSTSNQTKDYS